jgi:hypothetical protein
MTIHAPVPVLGSSEDAACHETAHALVAALAGLHVERLAIAERAPGLAGAVWVRDAVLIDRDSGYECRHPAYAMRRLLVTAGRSVEAELLHAAQGVANLLLLPFVWPAFHAVAAALLAEREVAGHRFEGLLTANLRLDGRLARQVRIDLAGTVPLSLRWPAEPC